MQVDYNKIAKKFALSRKSLHWDEIDFFFSLLPPHHSILDIGCGSARLVQEYIRFFGSPPQNYLGIDLSSELLLQAKQEFPNLSFLQSSMTALAGKDILPHFEHVFFVASFHHLSSTQERQELLQTLFSELPPNARVYMTNWALTSSVNREKYKKYELSESPNDFMIPFGDYLRYYHSFNLKELENSITQAGFHILMHTLSDSEKNLVSIFEK